MHELSAEQSKTPHGIRVRMKSERKVFGDLKRGMDRISEIKILEYRIEMC